MGFIEIKLDLQVIYKSKNGKREPMLGALLKVLREKRESEGCGPGKVFNRVLIRI